MSPMLRTVGSRCDELRSFAEMANYSTRDWCPWSLFSLGSCCVSLSPMLIIGISASGANGSAFYSRSMIK